MIARWFWREWRSPTLLIVWMALSGGSLRAGAGQRQRSHGERVKSAKPRVYGRRQGAAKLASRPAGLA